LKKFEVRILSKKVSLKKLSRPLRDINLVKKIPKDDFIKGLKMPLDRKQEEYLLKAVFAFRHRFIVVSPQMTILAINRTLKEKESDQFIGQPCFSALYKRTSPCERCVVKEAFEKGRAVLHLKNSHHPTLNRLLCQYAYPIYEKNRIEAIVNMDFDWPTQGDNIEDVFQRSSALLRNLIRSSIDGVIAADLKGKLIIFNNVASQITGYDEEEALHTLNIRDIYHKEDIAYEVMAKLRGDLHGGTGKLKSYQVALKSKKGDIIPISLNAAIVYEDKQEVATIGFFHDLRETIEMREKIDNIQLQLLQSEKMASLGKLAAGVAHQLNNPLGGITLFTRLVMEEYDLPENAMTDLERILKDAERCRDTVKELLEFTRQTRHLMRPHDINKALTRTIFLLERQSLFQNVAITTELSPKLPLIICDIQQINHIFMNIILNAGQAMEGKGKLNLRTYLMSEGNRVAVEISDTGPGIPSDILPNIFDPFFTTKEEGEGTGLGLSLVYSILENHSGSIKAHSTLGEGTTFHMELPISTLQDKGTVYG
jgi:PAS domain S-box-containing protein